MHDSIFGRLAAEVPILVQEVDILEKHGVEAWSQADDEFTEVLCDLAPL